MLRIAAWLLTLHVGPVDNHYLGRFWLEGDLGELAAHPFAGIEAHGRCMAMEDSKILKEARLTLRRSCGKARRRLLCYLSDPEF